MAISEVQSPREGAVKTLTEHPLMLSVNGENIHTWVMADTPLLLGYATIWRSMAQSTAAASESAAHAPYWLTALPHAPA
jgi:hypothetical protein